METCVVTVNDNHARRSNKDDNISLHLQRWTLRINDKSLLDWKGTWTKSELDLDVNTDLSVPGSNLHVLQREIYYNSKEPQRLALLPYGFEHQFCSCLLYFWRSFEFVSNTVWSFWFLCTQKLHFQPDTWSRPVVFILHVLWDIDTKTEHGSFWEGAADCCCDSNGVSLCIIPKTTKPKVLENLQQWFE